MTSSNAPLLAAIATGSDEDIKKAKAFCQGLSRVKEADANPREWASVHEQAWIPVADMQISRIRGDGHCLFAAIYCSWTRSLGRDLPEMFGGIGLAARALWVRIARKVLSGEMLAPYVGEHLHFRRQGHLVGQGSDG